MDELDVVSRPLESISTIGRVARLCVNLETQPES